MGVTGNAILLLGHLAGLMSLRDYPAYRLLSADPDAGEQVVEHARPGNTYRISVVQLSGTE